MAEGKYEDTRGLSVKIQLAVLADSANIAQDGRLNVLGIFNTIYAPSVPVTHPQMYFAMIYLLEENDRGNPIHIGVVCHDPDGAPLFGFESDVVIPLDAPLGPSSPQVIQIQLLQFERLGNYKFVVSINGQEEAVVPLHLTQHPPPQRG